MNESSISTHVRHQDLRARVNPRRNQSPFSRRSSVDWFHPRLQGVPRQFVNDAEEWIS